MALQVSEVPAMDTAPGGPWLPFLDGLTNLAVPFEPDAIPSGARREAAMQASAVRLAEHVRQAGLPGRPWVKRVQMDGWDWPRLMARTYWGAGDRSRFFFVFPGQATIGQAGCVGDDQAHLDRALRTYEVEVEEQTEAARKALQAQFPKVKRPKKWKFQHLSPLTTLVFAGGNYYVVQAP